MNPSVRVRTNIRICYKVSKKMRCQVVSSCQKFSNKDCNKLFTYTEFDIKHKTCAKSVQLLTYVLRVWANYYVSSISKSTVKRSIMENPLWTEFMEICRGPTLRWELDFAKRSEYAHSLFTRILRDGRKHNKDDHWDKSYSK